MIDAGKLNPEDPSDLVQFGDLWYGVAGTTPEGDVLFSHECPDGTVIAYPFAVEPWCDFWTAGERLAELRGELDDAELMVSVHRMAVRANRGRSLLWTAATLRLHEAREKTAAIAAQIDELERMGVTARVVLGPEKCPTCRGSGHPFENEDDICAGPCAGSGVNHG